MSLLISRDILIYVSNETSGWNFTNTIQLRTLDGFRFDQPGRTKRISNQSMKPTSERIDTVTLEELDWVSFSFDTYVVPQGGVDALDYLMAGVTGETIATTSSSGYVYDTATVGTASNVASLPEYTIWFTFGDTRFRLDNCVIDSAEFSFDINEIARVSWSGYAKSITTPATLPTFTDGTDISCPDYIKGRLTDVEYTRDGSEYSIPIIDGRFQINNNTKLASNRQVTKMTTPYYHETGALEITGELSAYLKIGTLKTLALYEEILTDAQTLNGANFENKSSELNIYLGGKTGVPRYEFLFDNVLLDIPEIDFQDVVVTKIPFYVRR